MVTDNLPKTFNMNSDINEQIQKLFDKEKVWKKKYNSLLSNVNDLRVVVNKHSADLKHNKYACPEVRKREIGVQVNCTSTHNKPVS